MLRRLLNILQYNGIDNELTHWYQDISHGPAGSLDIDSTESALAMRVGRIVLHPSRKNYAAIGQVPEKKS